jgi:hypothetical protein
MTTQKKTAVTIVKCDSKRWQGLYIDGELFMQHHEINIEDVLRELGIKFKMVDVSPKKLMGEKLRGSFPPAMVDI